MTSLRFLGAARMVSGSCLEIASDRTRLLVDHGMFLGYRHTRRRNWDPCPEGIDAVVLTQARLDHAGLLPRLLRAGYDGPVYATAGTRALCQVMLPGHGRLQEETAARARAGGYSRHARPEPLFTQAEGAVAAERVRAVDMGDPFDVGDMQIHLSEAGTLPGGASVHVRTPDTSILVSGDLGRHQDPLLRPPGSRHGAEHIVMECTYGDMHHRGPRLADALHAAITPVLKESGKVLIPAAAVGRTQSLLHALATLRQEGRLGAIPVHVDSPMAKEATQAFCDNPSGHRLGPDACLALMDMADFTSSEADGAALYDIDGPAIILAAEELATTGRVLGHLRHIAPDARNLILFAGHVVPGTRADALVAGASAVRVEGDLVPVEAQVLALPGASAHADQAGLLAWLADGPRARGVYLVHGDETAADALRVHIEDRFGWLVHVPALDERLEL